MIYRVEKSVRFEAAHHLEGMVDGHPCSNVHGHSYEATVALEADQLSEEGFVVDFTLIKTLIKGRYDHKNLNDEMSRNPTAENLALQIYTDVHELLFRLKWDKEVRVVQVTVRETPTSLASVRAS